MIGLPCPLYARSQNELAGYRAEEPQSQFDFLGNGVPGSQRRWTMAGTHNFTQGVTQVRLINVRALVSAVLLTIFEFTKQSTKLVKLGQWEVLT